jgi:glycosyltransferase involved in cell wall biosynthesis
MRVLYDFQTFKNRFGGIARYHYELSNGLRDLGEITDISTLLTPNEYLNADRRYNVINLLGNNDFRGKYRLGLYADDLNRKYSIAKIVMNKFDIFHPTYYDTYFEKYLQKPFVITVHDFVHEKYDTLRVVDIENKKKLILESDKIIAISNNTKNDIINYYNIPREKIEVIYHGVQKTKTRDLSNEFGEYILFVGDRKGYKNFNTFFRAMSLIMNKYKNIRLVCTGNPFSEDESCVFKEHNLETRIFQCAANDEKLNSLYRNALLFVYPSLYEGFGMPILEAFENNCPLCISKSSCFPEIALDAAFYFDPMSVESIYESINRMILDKDLRRQLTEIGQLRVKDFSWDLTCSKTLDVYRSII